MEDRMVLVFVVLAILALLGALAYVWVLPLLRISGLFIKVLWSLRRDLNPQKPPGRWRLLGLAVTVIAATFGVATRPLLEAEEIFLAILALLLCGATAYLATLCFWRAQRLGARSAVKPSFQDQRAPVVYLRSFQDDSKVYGRMEMTGLKFSTEEEVIAQLVGMIGPLVAIGRPGEVLPYAGAARLYVGMAGWQERVRTLLTQSELVIVRAGDTPGLRWEIKECIHTVRPERLIFLFPLSRSGYERFRRNSEQHFPCRLPEYTGRWIPNMSIRAVLLFDSTWNPTLVPLRQKGLSYWWRYVVRSQFVYADDVVGPSEMRRAFQNALQPLLRRGLHQP